MRIEEQYEKIYRYCYFHIGNRQTAEDLTQETFLRFLKQKRELRGGKEMAYLYTIARNLCIDCYRGRRQEEPFLEEQEGFLPMEETEERLDLARAVGQLSGELREILLLRYVNELGVSETAKLLGISRFAVYRKEKEGLYQLKKWLKGDGLYEKKTTPARAEKSI